MADTFPYLLLVGMVLMVANLVFLIMALADALHRPASYFEAASRTKGVWIALILLAQPIGSILYWARIRPGLTKPPPGPSLY